MVRGVVVAVAVVVASLAGVGIVSANESPVVSAGLDQAVTEGSMVYLDAGGSVDPDGSIERYRWEMTAPNGTTITPACPSCAQTRFRANQSGEYTVTVTATDDEGATRSDTLYISVAAADPPSVSVTGPATAESGTTASLTATATAGDSDLAALVWSVNGSEVGRQTVSETRTEQTFDHSVSKVGWRHVGVRAVDRFGNTDTATHVFQSTSQRSSDNGPPPVSPSPPSGNSGEPSGVYQEMLDRQENGNYLIHLVDGEIVGRGPDALLTPEQIKRIENTDGVEMITGYVNNGPVDTLSISNPELKKDIDLEAGRLGWGFHDTVNEHIDTSGSSYQLGPKYRKTSPGADWKKDGKRVEETKTVEEKVSKDNWRLTDTHKDETGNTYVAESPRDKHDRHVGYVEKTETRWQSTVPSEGRIVDTRQNTYYTWTETKQVCTEWTTVYGQKFCLDSTTAPQPVQRTGENPPPSAENVETTFTMEYKVERTVDRIPEWETVDIDYTYEVLEYKWVRTDV